MGYRGRNASDQGVAERVRFEVCDLSEPDDATRSVTLP
jgi:hypothetical protein